MTDRVELAHIRALDGLRGAAVAGVVLFHAGHLQGGFLGVDLFFVLSGYLITSLLLAESTSSGAIRLGAFWARRARRLLPALALLLVGVSGYCLVLAQPSELAQIRGDAWATVGYYANWRAIFSGADYWALFRAPSPLNHTWSLAIEEQFYLVWPLVTVGLLTLWKHHLARAVLVVSIGGAALSTALMWSQYDRFDPSRVYFGTDTRAGGILLGAALAAALGIWGPVRARATRIGLEVVGIASVATLAFMWVAVDGRSARLYQGGFLVAEVAAVVLIAVVVHPDRLVISRALAWGPLVGLGLISYGVYLWHWPVDVALTEARVGIGGWALFAVQVGCTLAISLASFVLVERPIRRGAGTRRQWTMAVPVLLAGVLVTTFAVTAAASGTPATRTVEKRLAHAVTRARTAPVGTRRVMVIGDSVGWYLGDAMAGVHTTPPQIVANLSLLACVFPSGASAVTYTATGETRSDLPSCDAKWDDALRTFRPEVVVMIGWVAGQVEYEYGGSAERPCDPQYLHRVRDQLTDATHRVARRGARFVITTYPETASDARSVAATRAVACVNAVRREVARRTGSQLVDLARFVCPIGRACVTQAFGLALRPDGVHFRGPTAPGIAKWILMQIGSISA